MMRCMSASSQDPEQIQGENRTDDCQENGERDLPRPLLAGFVQRVLGLFHRRVKVHESFDETRADLRSDENTRVSEVIGVIPSYRWRRRSLRVPMSVSRLNRFSPKPCIEAVRIGSADGVGADTCVN